jgi:hypothetical protein
VPGPGLPKWPRLGFDGDPLPGDPQVLQRIVDDFTYLRDTAWMVSQGLDAIVASASSGGFEGATADALREVISGRLKAFVFNIARAFSLAGEAVAEYWLVLTRAQQTVSGALSQTAGLAAGDPRPARPKRQMQEQLDEVNAAARRMEQALRDASEMVSQPIKVPSLLEKIWKGVETALEITGMALLLLSAFVDGPFGLWGFGLSAAAFAMNTVDYAEGWEGWQGLALSSLGVLLPDLRGVFSLAEVGAGAYALVGGVGHAGVKAAEVLSSPAAFREFLARTVAVTRRGLARATVMALRGLGDAPEALRRGAVALPEALAKTPGLIGDGLRWVGDVIGRDFDRVVKWYPGLVAGVEAHTAYGLVNLARVAGALFTPMTFHEMATLGFRGAWVAMRERASLANAVRDVRAGWRGYEGRAARAGMDVFAMLHGMYLPDYKPEPVVRVPGPVKGAEGADGKLGEPHLAPVMDWSVHDPVYGAATRMRSGLWVAGGAEGEAGRGVFPAVGRLEATGLTRSQRTRLVDVLFPPASPVVTTRPGSTAPLLYEDAQDFAGAPDVPRTGVDLRGTSDLLRTDQVGRPEPGAETHLVVGMVRIQLEHPDEREPADLLAPLERLLFSGGSTVSDVVATDRLISEAVARARAAGRSPAELLHRTRMLRAAVQEQLVENALRAVEGFSRLAGHEVRWRHLIDGFAVTVLDGGGHTVVHAATGLRTVFDARDRWILRDIPLMDGAQGPAGQRVTITRGWAEDGREARSYEMRGESAVTARFDAVGVEEGPSAGHAFVVTDMAAGHRSYYDSAGTQCIRDVWVGDQGQATGLGYLRFDSGQPDGALPRLVDAHGDPLERVRVRAIAPAIGQGGLESQGRVSLVPTAAAPEAPREELMVSARDGRPLEEVLGVRDVHGWYQGAYLVYDHVGGSGFLGQDPALVGAGQPRVLPVGVRRESDSRNLILVDSQGRDIFIRPALGSDPECRPDFPWGMVPRWLMGGGTVRRLSLDAPGRFQMWVPLPSGGARQARVCVSDHGLTLTAIAQGRAVGAGAEFTRGAEGLTVRVPVPYAPPAARAESLFDAEGVLVRQEWPLAGDGALEGLGSLRVVMDCRAAPAPAAYRPQPGQGMPPSVPVRWAYELAGASDAMARFRLEPVPEELHRLGVTGDLFGEHHDHVFAITEQSTGHRRYYHPDSPGRPVVWETRLEVAAGRRLRLLYGRNFRSGQVTWAMAWDGNWHTRVLGDGRVTLVRAQRAPLLVHPVSGRIEAPARFWWDEDGNGVTGAFPVTGAPDAVPAEYRFAADAQLTRADLPLTGGGAGEAHLSALRAVVEWGGARDVFEPGWELYGEGSAFFRLGGLAADASLVRELGDGFVLTELPTGIRRHYGLDGRLAYREVPLDEGRYLRMGACGRAVAPRVVRADGRPVRLRRPVESLASAGGLTVRVPVPYAPPRARAELLFDAEGVLVRQEWPLAGHAGQEGLGSLRVVMTPLPGQGAAGSPPRWAYELAGAPAARARFRVEPLAEQLQESALVESLSDEVSGRVFGRVFVITDQETGHRHYYRFNGRPLARELPVAGEPGLRLVRDPGGTDQVYTVYDESGNQLTTLDVGGGWLAVGRGDSAPLRVHPVSGRVDRPVEHAGDEQRMMARFAVPGAPLALRAGGTPAGVTAEYRFDFTAGHEQLILRQELPLTGGSAGEAHLGALRVVVEYTRREVRPGLTRIDRLPQALLGEGSRQLVLQRSGTDTGLRREFGGGFTVTGSVFAVRRQYGPGGDLVYRDVPLGEGRYLRVAADRQDRAPRVVYANGGVAKRGQPEVLVRDAEGLTVGVPVSYAPEGARAWLRFDAEGMLVRQEWPLAGHAGLEGLGSLRVAMTLLPGQGAAGSPPRWAYELLGPSHVAAWSRIRLPAPDFPASDLAWDLGHDRVVMIADQHTGRYDAYAFDGRRLAQGLPVEGEEGLWLVDDTADDYRIFDGSGNRLPDERAGLDWSAVLREDGPPLFIHSESYRVVRATAYTRNGDGATARFMDPDGPGGPALEYRFDANGRLTGLGLPLLGGSAAEAHLSDLRVYADDSGGWRELRGRGSELFRLQQIQTFAHPARGLEGGFTLTELVSGLQRQYTAEADLVYRDVPVEEGCYLRMDVGSQRSPWMVGANGRQVRFRQPMELLRTAEGMTVRVPVSYAPEGVLAELQFDTRGMLVRQEWPLAGYGPLAGLGSLRMVMDRGPDPCVPGWTYELVVPSEAGDGVLVRQEWTSAGEAGWAGLGSLDAVMEQFPGLSTLPLVPRWAYQESWPSGMVHRYWIELPTGDFPARPLARDLGSDRVLGIIDRDTGAFGYYSFNGTFLAARTPLDGQPGLWVVYGPRVAAHVYDEVGERISTARLGGGWLSVVRQWDVPLLVFPSIRSTYVQMPTRFAQDTEGVTASFALPGMPDEATVEFRFAMDGQVLREEWPLFGGGADEAHLGELRVAVTQTGQVTRELHGRDSWRFSLGEPAAADGMPPGSFTLTEQGTGIRRYYDLSYRLAYRDLPVGPLVGQEGYLRAGVTVSAGELRVVRADGTPLAGWRAERDGDGRAALVPTAWDHLPEGDRPLTRMVIDTDNGRLLREILHIREGSRPRVYLGIDYGGDGRQPSAYWWTGNGASRVGASSAVPLDSTGRGLDPIPGIRIAVSPDFGMRLLADVDDRVIFDRARWDIVAGRPHTTEPALSS